MEDLRFKVNLEGIINLLSNNLYSSPKVYIRELLQNGVDAITARKIQDINHEGEILVEVIKNESGDILFFEDNGVGLTEDEVHKFLSIIGETSKRKIGIGCSDYIGRFGVGLLSCFVVSDEIVVITKSIKDSPAVKWSGRPDGTYDVKIIEDASFTGTRIYLKAKVGFEEYFQPEMVKELLFNYGCILKYPIYFLNGKNKILINDIEIPWEQNAFGNEMYKEKVLEFGNRLLGQEFEDYIPISSSKGNVQGIAYIIPYKVSPNAKSTNRVYLKNVLVTEKSQSIMPDWAFFLKAIVNAEDLEPTASREELYEDENLLNARDEIGDCIKRYLSYIGKNQLGKLQKIIKVHYNAIKAIAIDDDELYELFIKWLPFETNFGELTMEEIMRENGIIRYTESVDSFRQISKIAVAQSLCIINGGYAYDKELIERLPEFNSSLKLELIKPSDVLDIFEDISLEERDVAFDFMRTAEVVLNRYKCEAEIKKFSPGELQALYSLDDNASVFRNIQSTKENSNALFSSIMDNFSNYIEENSYAKLCFNYNNSFIKRIINIKDDKLQKSAIEMIYIQAILQGHYILNKDEIKLMNTCGVNLIDWALSKGDKNELVF